MEVYRYVFDGMRGFILIMNQSETRFFVWKGQGLAMIFREMLDEAGGADFQLFWHTNFCDDIDLKRQLNKNQILALVLNVRQNDVGVILYA